MKRFKIDNDIKADVKQWCLDNLGTESVRWWFEDAQEEIMFRLKYE